MSLVYLAGHTAQLLYSSLDQKLWQRVCWTFNFFVPRGLALEGLRGMKALNRLPYWLVLFQALSIYNYIFSSRSMARTAAKPIGLWRYPHPSGQLDPRCHSRVLSWFIFSFPSKSCSYVIFFPCIYSGTTIYFMSLLWPYTVDTAISLDFYTTLSSQSQRPKFECCQ